MKRVYMLSAIAAVSFFTSSASAYVIGTITENPCSGGGVTVTATTITWSGTCTPPGGNVNTGLSTALSWTGGTLGPGVNGTIKNLTSGGGVVDQFMTFPAPSPVLDFVLTLLGPGSPNIGMAACAAANSNGAPGCSIVAGSPFILTYDNGSTDVALHALGTIVDPGAPSQSSIWSGGFSVTIANQTPSQVYNTFVTAGSIQVGQQGQFTLTTVPEPGTVGMLLIGGVLVAFARKRKAKA